MSALLARMKRAPSRDALQKLFSDPIVWKAFEAEQDRRRAALCLQSITTLEQAQAEGSASREDVVRLKVQRLLYGVFAGREEDDGIGRTQGCA